MSDGNAGRHIEGIRNNHADREAGTPLAGARALVGLEVCDKNGEYLGEIKDIMLETSTGRVAYAVLSFGDFIGLESKLYAVPWNALKPDTANARFVLDVDKERLRNAPGFDQDDWPDMTDQSWVSGIQSYYGSVADARDCSVR